VIIRPATGDDARFLGDCSSQQPTGIPIGPTLPEPPCSTSPPIDITWKPGRGRATPAWSPRTIRVARSARPGSAPFDADDPGYGFVAADIPEVAVAVVPDARGKGISAVLLAELAQVAADATCVPSR